MKNKSFLSKFDALKPKIPVQIEVEKKLLPRLKLMGYIMSVLSAATLIFALVIKEDSTTPESIQAGFPVLEEIEASSGMALLMEEGELEFNPTEVLNFYIVSLIFATIGISCFLITRKKRKRLSL